MLLAADLRPDPLWEFGRSPVTPTYNQGTVSYFSGEGGGRERGDGRGDGKRRGEGRGGDCLLFI